MWTATSLLIRMGPLLAVAKLQPQCGGNEEFRSCGTCETTCEEILSGIIKLCLPHCLPAGCHCIHGFVRDGDDKCVNRNSCRDPNICGLLNGLPLPNFECGPGMRRCPGGFICRGKVDGKGICCPIKACPVNEELKICGPCDTTCKQALKNETAICTEACRTADCGCKTDLFRNTDGQCITKLQCKVNADPNICGLLSGPPLPNFECGPGVRACPGGYVCKTDASSKGVCCALNSNLVCKDGSEPFGPQNQCGFGSEKCPPGFKCESDLVAGYSICCPVKVKVLCKDGSEPVGSQNQCGLGGQTCPPGSTCEADPADRFAICCREDPFKDICGPDGGIPLPNLNCGRGGRSCPANYFCKIDPANRYDVCCPSKAAIIGMK